MSDEQYNLTDPDPSSEKALILAETSTVPWHELQKLFASGVVLSVDKSLDLINVAYQMKCDDKVAIETLLQNELLFHVTNDQAKHWYAENTLLWSVVVKPWVLVQDK